MTSSIILRKFKLPKNTSPGLDCFTGQFDPKFEEELVPLVRNLFQKTEERTFFNSFSEVSITLVQNQRWRMKKKDRKKRKEGKKGDREGEKETIGQSIFLMNIDAKKFLTKY